LNLEKEKVISYENIQKSIEFYGRRGFNYMEVPWIIPKNINQETHQNKVTVAHLDLESYRTNKQEDSLVGSAEQSFRCLDFNHFALEGRLIAVTPCFRDDAPNYWHQKYFIKSELFYKTSNTEEVLQEFINAAYDFFISFQLNILVTKTSDYKALKSYDIIDQASGQELGSYGIRILRDGNTYVYGTGCAEPRLSKVVKYNGMELKKPWDLKGVEIEAGY
jgi:hypothetical protein